MAAYHSDEILDAPAAAAALRRVQPVLPQGGRLPRQGHPRHLPRALVRQGRDVRLHHRRGVLRRAPAAAGVGEGVPRQARALLPRDRRGGRRPRPVGPAEVRLRGVDRQPGPLPRAHLDLQLHRLPDPSPRHPRTLRRTARSGRSRPSTAPSARPTGRSSRCWRPTSRRTGRCGCPRRCGPTSAGSTCSSRSPRELARTERWPAVSDWQPRLVALDIDGTLLKWVEGVGTTYEQISPPVYDAVHRARAAGAHIVLASGRSPHGMTRIADLLDLHTDGDDAAVGGGEQRRRALPLPPARGRPRGDLRRRPGRRGGAGAPPDRPGRGRGARGRLPRQPPVPRRAS